MKRVAGFLCMLALAASGAGEEPYGLTVERLADPCGVDAAAPRFGWKMAAANGTTDARQTAYRVLVASSLEKLASDTGDMWDSGKVAGDRSIDVAYGGAPLASSRRYWWKVRTWDGTGEASAWSVPSEWVTGILPPDAWKAKWIGPAPETRPDADLAGAHWITAPKGKKGTVTLRRTFTFSGAKRGEYAEMILPGDLYVLEHANRFSSYNILHCCSWAGDRNQLELWKDYPVKCVNWGVYVEQMPLADGRFFFGDKACLGGFESLHREGMTHKGLLHNGTETEIREFTRELILTFGKRGLLLGADCTVNSAIDHDRIRWVVETARSI